LSKYYINLPIANNVGMGCGSSKVAVSTIHVEENAVKKNGTTTPQQQRRTPNEVVLQPCDDSDRAKLGSSNKLLGLDSNDSFPRRKKNLFSSLECFEEVDKKSTHVSVTYKKPTNFFYKKPFRIILVDRVIAFFIEGSRFGPSPRQLDV